MAKKQSAVVAALLERREEFIKELGEIRSAEDLQAFWGRHPRLNIIQVFDVCGDEPELVHGIFEVAIDIAENERDEYIELLARTFIREEQPINVLEAMLKGVQIANKRLQERDIKTRTGAVIRYLSKFQIRTVNPGRTSHDCGKTWLVYTEDDIKRTIAAMKNEGKRVICSRTVLQRIESEKEFVALEA